MDKLYIDIAKCTINGYFMFGYYQKLINLKNQYDGKINMEIKPNKNKLIVYVSLPKYQSMKQYVFTFDNLAKTYNKLLNDIRKLQI